MAPEGKKKKKNEKQERKEGETLSKKLENEMQRKKKRGRKQSSKNKLKTAHASWVSSPYPSPLYLLRAEAEVMRPQHVLRRQQS